MVQLIFIRHGQADHNNKKLSFLDLARQTNSSLTEEGRKEIEFTSRILVNYQPEVIYSSPLLRAVQSSQIIQSYFEKKIPTLSIVEDGRLNRLSFNIPKVTKKVPTTLDKNQGGIASFVNQIKRDHQTKTVFVVAHFHAYYLILRHLSGVKLLVDFRGLLQDRIRTGEHRLLTIK